MSRGQYDPNAPAPIQRVLDQDLARRFAEYIRRHRQRYQYPNSGGAEVTLRRLCRRFRLSQAVARRVIGSVSFLAVSEYAYRPADVGLPEGASVPLDSPAAGQIFMASFLPQHWPEAPWGWRIVVLFEENLDAAGPDGAQV